MTKPIVHIAITTWPNHPLRFEYFQRMLGSLFQNLEGSIEYVKDQYLVKFFCSAETKRDSNFQWMGPDLEAYCYGKGITLFWHEDKPNLGANTNFIMQKCLDDGAEFIYMQQDDWELRYPLDLITGIRLLDAENVNAHMIRYSWPDVDRMRPKFVDDERYLFHQEYPGIKRIDPRSHWFYGDDPHLRRADFFNKFGWYLEGGAHASASMDMMNRLRKQGAKIYAADRCYYKHFGQISAYPNDSRAGRDRRKFKESH